VYDGTTNAFPVGLPALLAAESLGTGNGFDGAPYMGDAVGISGLPSAGYNTADVNTATTVSFGMGTLALTGAQAGNYGLIVQSPVAATITPAPVTVNVASSQNPSGNGTSVSFTATVSPVVAGNIVFTTNSATFDTEALNSGSAVSATTSVLPLGTTTVTATYGGNPDYSGSGILNGGQVVTNSAPPSQPVLHVNVSANQVQISFNVQAGHQYDLQRSTNLAAGTGWVFIGTNNSTSNAVFTVTDAFLDIGFTPSAAYYRVLVP
jgi:hypothetical protein